MNELRERLFDLWRLQFYQDVAEKQWATTQKLPISSARMDLGIKCDTLLRERWDRIGNRTKRVMGLVSYKGEP